MGDISNAMTAATSGKCSIALVRTGLNSLLMPYEPWTDSLAVSAMIGLAVMAAIIGAVIAFIR
jgi:hypothetical protein